MHGREVLPHGFLLAITYNFAIAAANSDIGGDGTVREKKPAIGRIVARSSYFPKSNFLKCSSFSGSSRIRSNSGTISGL